MIRLFRIRLRSSGERGQSLVEFSVSLIILLILITVIFDASRALFTYLSLRDAAQEGAIYASIEPTDADNILNRVCEASNMVKALCADEDGQRENDWTTSELTNGTGIDVNISFTGAQCMSSSEPSNSVRITVRHYNFPLTMPLVGEFVGAGSGYTVPITASILDTIITPACSP
jgi:Flp pilus assembly protein TadG